MTTVPYANPIPRYHRTHRRQRANVPKLIEQNTHVGGKHMIHHDPVEEMSPLLKHTCIQRHLVSLRSRAVVEQVHLLKLAGAVEPGLKNTIAE